MYVCICNALNERQIGEAIDNGARTPLQIYAHWDCEPQCAQCVDELQEYLDVTVGGGALVRVA